MCNFKRVSPVLEVSHGWLAQSALGQAATTSRLKPEPQMAETACSEVRCVNLIRKLDYGYWHFDTSRVYPCGIFLQFRSEPSTLKQGPTPQTLIPSVSLWQAPVKFSSDANALPSSINIHHVCRASFHLPHRAQCLMREPGASSIAWSLISVYWCSGEECPLRNPKPSTTHLLLVLLLVLRRNAVRSAQACLEY